MDIVILIIGIIVAGFIGSILGLGGGVFMVPILTIIFDFPIASAVGTSLAAIVVTSLAASTVYLRRGNVCLEAAYRLELFTVIGASIGGLTARYMPARAVAILFGAVLIFAALQMVYEIARKRLGNGNNREPDSEKEWDFSRCGMITKIEASAGSILAGTISALMGVGGGVVKVPILNLILGVPIRIAVGTSELMIGITAGAGASHYLLRGQVNPVTALIVAGSIFIGARTGALVAGRLRTDYIKMAFSLILVYIAIMMFIKY
jgi:uncharacterized membrane protein YfcA